MIIAHSLQGDPFQVKQLMMSQGKSHRHALLTRHRCPGCVHQPYGKMSRGKASRYDALICQSRWLLMATRTAKTALCSLTSRRRGMIILHRTCGSDYVAVAGRRHALSGRSAYQSRYGGAAEGVVERVRHHQDGAASKGGQRAAQDGLREACREEGAWAKQSASKESER